jgi:hypothetical protein
MANYKITTGSYPVDDVNYKDTFSKILDITKLIYEKTEKLRQLQIIQDRVEDELANTRDSISDTQKELDDCIKQRDELEGREKGRGVWVPLPVPTSPPTPFNPYVPYVPYMPYAMHNKCEVCGIDFSSAMGYCCSNMNCPIPRATC